jgi:hypothetical protein
MCVYIGKKGAVLLFRQLESLSPLLSLAMHDFSFAASMESSRSLNKRGEKISY